MNSSCIAHPKDDRFIVIRNWQIEACDGNRCAAALLSFFEYSHNWKVENAAKMCELNDAAERMGQPRKYDESLVQWHNEQQLEQGILNQYAYKTIRVALALLLEKGFIETAPHKYIRANGLPDRTRHFLFRPDLINDWISNHQAKMPNGDFPIRQKCPIGRAKMPEQSGKNAPLTYKDNQKKHSERTSAHATNEITQVEAIAASPEFTFQSQSEAIVEPLQNSRGAVPQRGPLFDAATDARLQTAHCQAVANVCQVNIALASPKRKGQIILAGVSLAEAGYTPEQIELVGKLWPYQSAPQPSQIGDNITALLNQKEKTNGYKSVGEQRAEQFENIDNYKRHLEAEIAAADFTGDNADDRSDVSGLRAVHSGGHHAAQNDRALGGRIHALPYAR